VRRHFKAWVYEGKTGFLAHALETDTVAQGKTTFEAVSNLRQSLKDEWDYMQKSGVNCWKRAPEEYWNRAKRDGVVLEVEI